MRVKQANVCEKCRAKKLGCDGKNPACTQCSLRGHVCKYVAGISFRPYGGSNKTARKAAVKRIKKAPRHSDVQQMIGGGGGGGYGPGGCLLYPVAWPLRDIISLCAQNFVPSSELHLSFAVAVQQRKPRICASWIELLPMLFGSADADHLLSSATKALALAIMARKPNRMASVYDALQAQTAALRDLHVAVKRASVSSFNGIATAIMCIFLSEMLLPTSAAASEVHAEGVGRFLQLRPPDFYATGMPHTLFLAFRPVLITHAFMARKHIFLATPTWQTMPFSVNPPNRLQALMSYGSSIPSLLAKLESINSAPSCGEQCQCKETLDGFLSVLDCILGWHRLSLIDGQAPLSFTVNKMDMTEEEAVSFPDITAANCLTHFWAFWLLCVVSIRDLRAEHERAGGKDISVGGEAPESVQLSKKMVLYVSRICQSVAYFLQDDMHLYGAASVSVPLQTACTMIDGGKVSGPQLRKMLRDIREMVFNKGYEDMLMSRPPQASPLEA